MVKIDIKSPIRYVGGKARVMNELLKYYPTNIDEYREPFIGGGSMLIEYLKNREKPKKITIGDFNYDIIILWENIINNREELKEVTIELIDKILKDGTLENNLDPFGYGGVKAASIELVANTCRMFGNTGGKYYNEATVNKLKRLKYSLDNKIDPISKMFKGVEVRNQSYEWALQEGGELDNVLVVLDPPYYDVADKNGYYKGHNEFDFEELRKQLINTKHKFIMTIDKSEYSELLGKDFNINEFYIRYKMSHKIATECIVTNF